MSDISATIERYKYYLLFAALSVLVYFPVFLHLGNLPIRMWDESVTGVIAHEMAVDHNYIVTHFFGSANIEFRPPLMIWCVLLTSKITGFNELALRLPSAIAAAVLCLSLFSMLRRYTGSGVFGFMAVCILITCQGYIRNHVTRTGEYDSLLVLFSTLSSLSFFFAVEAETENAQSRYLWWFFVFLTLALLSKGTFCLVMLLTLFIYVVLRKKLVSILSNRNLYGGIAFFIVFGAGYYFLREWMSPGYLHDVWRNELGGRFGHTLDGHEGPFGFYLHEIVSWQFTWYLIFLPLGLLAGIAFCGRGIRRLVVFSSISALCFWLVISVSKTKIPHYDAILFPYLAIITASFFYFIYLRIKGLLSNRYAPVFSSAIALVCFLVFYSGPYVAILQKVYFPKGDAWEDGFYNRCHIMQDAVQHKVSIDHTNILFPQRPDTNIMDRYGQSAVLECYQYSLHDAGIDVTMLYSIDDVKPNTKVIVYDNELKAQLQKKFAVVVLERLGLYDADVLEVKGEI